MITFSTGFVSDLFFSRGFTDVADFVSDIFRSNGFIAVASFETSGFVSDLFRSSGFALRSGLEALISLGGGCATLGCFSFGYTFFSVVLDGVSSGKTLLISDARGAASLVWASASSVVAMTSGCAPSSFATVCFDVASSYSFFFSFFDLRSECFLGFFSVYYNMCNIASELL